MVNDQQKVHCSLVMAKSRVTPLKPVTVPRLELTAAVVSTKISAFLQKELKYGCVPEYFWTDSKVVLGYISNEARRFHTFVANRVQAIRDHTSPDQWHYVDTKDNPADDASRGLGAGELIKSDRWWNGPNFLWIPQLEIPASEPQISPEDPEVKKVTVLATKSMEHSSLLERIAYFSDWYRTKRAIAICQLFIERMKLRAKKLSDPPIRNDMDPPLEGIRSEQQERSSKCITMTVKDLQRAELLLIKEVQCHAFPEEVKALETHRKEQRGEIHRREKKGDEQIKPHSSP